MRHLAICASFGLATLGLMAASTSSEHGCATCQMTSAPALLLLADGHGNGNGNGNIGNGNGSFNQGNGNGNGNIGSFNGNFNRGNGHGNCTIGNGHGNFDRDVTTPNNQPQQWARAHCRSTWQQNYDSQQKILEHMLQSAPWRSQHQGG